MDVREFLRIQDFLIYRDGFLFKDWCQYVINMSLCWGRGGLCLKKTLLCNM